MKQIQAKINLNIIILFTFLFLFFSLSSKAVNINEFQIEGISLGNSLLDYYTENQINNVYEYKYKHDKFRYYVFELKEKSNYDYLQITTKTNSQYIIHGIAGVSICNLNIEECYKKQEKIKTDLDSFFNIEAIKKNGKHSMDDTGNSIWTSYKYYISDNDYAEAEIMVYDNSDSFVNDGFWDSTQVMINSPELLIFINTEAWK